MNEKEEQLKVARKSMLYGFITFAVLMLITQWYATQSVAEQCNYNALLGARFVIGDWKIYFPFSYYMWCNDETIAGLIPSILAPYKMLYYLCVAGGFGVFYVAKSSMKVATEHGSASFATQKDIIDSGLGDTVEVENPADILRNQMWDDVHNIEESFFTINALPENTKKERIVKQKRWKNYWEYIKKNRPKDTKEQRIWDWEHNLEDYDEYAKSLPEGSDERDSIETRILKLYAERDALETAEERENWDKYHNIRKRQEAANDYKDRNLKKQVWDEVIHYILKNRPKGSEEQQKWDNQHNINRIIKKLREDIEDIENYISDNRPKPETEEEIRRFAISKHPRPTEKQVEWDKFHNLRETVARIKSNKELKDAERKSMLESINAYIKSNQPEKDTEEYFLWWRHHNLNLNKKNYMDKLKKWEAFISKGCPKPKKIKQPKNSGVVVGINPFTHKLMLHDGVEHILLMAPTRSGKGVCTIVPTGLIWAHSIFFFDPKGELWGLTSGYRKHVLRQKVLKFQPLCKDGSAARWNPLAEVNYRSFEELSDVQSITGVMVRPDGESKGDDFWPNSAQALLNGVIMHLLYKHDQEGLPLPCPTDIMSFLSTPDKSTDELFTGMKTYPHISVEEFLEEPIKDENGNIQYDKNGVMIRRKNPLKEIYGEYIKNFKEFSDALGITVRSIDEIRTVLQYKIDQGETICWTPEIAGLPSGQPFYQLLTHPKVAECAANILNGAEQTRASIMQTAQTSLAIYQDPVVQTNTAVSDFAIRDLLDPKQEVSLYLVMEVKDIAAVKPIARLFIQMICSKLIQDMKFGSAAKGLKKQRLLLMLDEFPQLGNMKCIELALAICAGYGIKMCIVCQDVNQLNKEYTKDNSIGSNCHLHIYFTPNIDSGGATAESISKQLGKKTIKTVSHSDGGGGFFKGSDSTSSTGRELMTPDEVSHMSSEKELVFVAGHKPIFGDKLRFYQHDWLLNRTKIDNPPTSDSVTRIVDYKTMFKIREAEVASKEKERLVVLADKAEKEGVTLKQYLLRDEEERLKREKEIIRKLTGQTDDSEEQQNGEEFEDNSRNAESRENVEGTESTKTVDDEMAGRHTSIPETTSLEERKRLDRERIMLRRQHIAERRRSAINNTRSEDSAGGTGVNVGSMTGTSSPIDNEAIEMGVELLDKTERRPARFNMGAGISLNQSMEDSSDKEEENHALSEEADAHEEYKAPQNVEEPTEPDEDDDVEVQEPNSNEPASDKSEISESDFVNFFNKGNEKEDNPN